jgi:hypothetical protein
MNTPKPSRSIPTPCRYCLVPNCGESGSQGFFCLPTDKEEARKWLDSVGASHTFLHKKNVRICYQHFRKEHFKLDGKYYKVKKGIVL